MSSVLSSATTKSLGDQLGTESNTRDAFLAEELATSAQVNGAAEPTQVVATVVPEESIEPTQVQDEDDLSSIGARQGHATADARLAAKADEDKQLANIEAQLLLDDDDDGDEVEAASAADQAPATEGRSATENRSQNSVKDGESANLSKTSSKSTADTELGANSANPKRKSVPESEPQDDEEGSAERDIVECTLEADENMHDTDKDGADSATLSAVREQLEEHDEDGANSSLEDAEQGLAQNNGHVQLPRPSKSEANQTLVAHCPGRVVLSIQDDGTNIFSGGSDGVIKSFAVTGNHDKTSTDCIVDSEVMALAAHPTKELVAVADPSGAVKLLKFPSGELSELLCRLPGPARCLAFSADGSRIAVGTSEHHIRIVTVEDTSKAIVLTGHRGPIRAIRWHPTEPSFLVSTAADGDAKVWKLDGDSGKAHTISDILPADRQDDLESPRVDIPAWSPDGQLLAIPSSGAVLVFRNGAWLGPKTRLTSTDLAKECNAVDWSPNGRYLAATSVDGGLSIWDARSGEQVLSGEEDLNLGKEAVSQGLIWLPKRNDLAVVSVDGDLSIFRNVVPANLASPIADEQGGNTGSGSSQVDEAALREQIDFDRMEEDEDDEGNHGSGSRNVGDSRHSSAQVLLSQVEARVEAALKSRLSRRPGRQLAFQPGSTEPEDDRRYLAWNATGSILLRSEDTYNSVEIEFANSASNRTIRFTDHYGFDMAALSDTGAIFASRGSFQAESTADPATSAGRPSDDAADNSVDDEDWDPPSLDGKGHGSDQAGGAAAQNGQSALQAALEAYDRAEAEGSVPVSEDVVGANKAPGTASDMDLYGAPSTVFFRPFNSWAHNAEWTLRLPAKEKARCVAAGASFCAVASNRRMLRIFRPSGIQEAPFLLPGPVLAMAGGGSNLLVLFHRAEPSEFGTQSIGYALYDLDVSDRDGVALLTQGPLSVPARERNPVRWVGIADNNLGFMPFVMDSKGVLSGLCHGVGWAWVPFLDAKDLAQHRRFGSLWPVSVQTGKLMCAALKPGQLHPDAFPRPVLTGIELEIPLLGVHDATGALKHQIEEGSLRGALTLAQVKLASREQGLDEDWAAEEVAKLDAKMIKHIVLSIKLQRPARAFGIARRLRLARSVQIALIQAQKAEADSALLERLERLLAQREEEEADADEDEEAEEGEEDSDDEQTHTATGRKGEVTGRSAKGQGKRVRSGLGNSVALSSAARALGRKRLSVDSTASFQPEHDSDVAASAPGDDEAASAPRAGPAQATKQAGFQNPFALKSSKAHAQTISGQQGSAGKRQDQGLMSAFVRSPTPAAQVAKRRKY